MTDETTDGQDRKNIGLPKNSFHLLEELVSSTPWFDQQQDAYRLAIVIALARGWKPSADSTETFETKFSVGGVDPERELRALIGAYAPDSGDKPYDYAQRLALAGVQYLHKELVEKRRSLSEVLGLDPSTVASGDGDGSS